MKLNRKTLAMLAVVAMLAIAGCGAQDNTADDAQELGDDTNSTDG